MCKIFNTENCNMGCQTFHVLTVLTTNNAANHLLLCVLKNSASSSKRSSEPSSLTANVFMRMRLLRCVTVNGKSFVFCAFPRRRKVCKNERIDETRGKIVFLSFQPPVLESSQTLSVPLNWMSPCISHALQIGFDANYIFLIKYNPPTCHAAQIGSTRQR